jgi:2,5-diketo-D-gluconate reductase B
VTESGIPRIGLGTSRRDSEDGLRAIVRAVEVGYRHLDTAQNDGTEAHVGEAVRRSGLPRGDFFITTKVADHRLRQDDFLASVPESLKRLRMDYVDLLLVHWPVPEEVVPPEEYLTALAEAQRRGWARLIGVSNFTIAHLERARTLLGDGALATNQVEIHPFLQVPRMRDWARAHGLPLTAYQPLAKATVGDDPVLREIGARHGVPASSVALAFLLAEGHIVIPSAGSEEHLRANLAAGEVALSAEEMAAIRAVDRGGRRINPGKSPRWDD